MTAANVSPVSRLLADRGSVTLWTLGLCLVVLLLGGLSVDLWRAFSERRALAGAADAAAAAGASGIDEQQWRDHDVPRLDPDRAEALAAEALAAQTDVGALTGASIDATGEQITVTLHGRVDFSLLRLLPSGGPLDITVTAHAGPRASG